MIRLLVFDFDGVLVDSNALKSSAYLDVLQDVPGAADIVAAVQAERPEGDRYEIFEQILRRMPTPPIDIATAVQDCASRYNSVCEQGTSTCPEIEGVSAVLPQLQSHYRLAINSDTPQEPLCRVVQKRGWGGWFQDVLGRPTSKEQNFAHLLEKHHVKPSECLFLGDRERDRRAAELVGCHFVGMKNRGNNFLKPPIHQIENWHDFLSLLPVYLTQEAGHV